MRINQVDFRCDDAATVSVIRRGEPRKVIVIRRTALQANGYIGEVELHSEAEVLAVYEALKMIVERRL